MREIVYETTKHIDSQMPVTQVSSVAVICTADQFQKAGDNWESLVRTDNWKDTDTVLDTVLFADELEKTMGRVQLEKTGACNWDILKLISKNDWKNRTIAKAIPCENGQQYVVGVFKWK